MMLVTQQQELVLTLRKLTVKDRDLQEKKIKFGVVIGSETLWVAHQKIIKKGIVRFFGESFSFRGRHKKIEFLIEYEYQDNQWRTLTQIGVSKNEIDSFSTKKTVFCSEQSNIELIWECYVEKDCSESLSGTFIMGQRDFEDFSDHDLLSPMKRNHQMTYSPGRFPYHKNFQQFQRKDTLSQRKSSNGDIKKITSGTNDTLEVKQFGSIIKTKKKLCDKRQIQTDNGLGSQIMNQRKISNKKRGLRMSESMMHLSYQIPKKKVARQHDLQSMNEKLSTRSLILAGFLGAVSGVSGAMMSLV